MTSGEMLVGPAKLMLLDEISTGLDSSTTFTIMSMMRRYVHIMHGTILCGLLQPQPETFELFDEVVLISAGKVGLGGLVAWCVAQWLGLCSTRWPCCAR